MLRKKIPLKYRDKEYEILCTAGLLMRIEDRVFGISIQRAMHSDRLIDAAWVVGCALREAEAGIPPGEEGNREVLEAVMDDMGYYVEKAGEILVELVLPEAAVGLGDDEDSEGKV